MKCFAAELIGTFMIVSMVCGVDALGLAGALPVAVAVGLATAAMMSAVGHVSGGHFNPAITIGLAAAGRHPVGDTISFIVAQVAGAVAAAFVWYVIALESSDPGKAAALGNFAANGFDAGSPGHFNMAGVALAEALATALLVVVYVGTVPKHVAHGFAPFAMGCAIAALLLVTIPISNGSLNPARSTATALFGGQLAVSQLWLFWAAPFVGAVLGGFFGRWIVARNLGSGVVAGVVE